MLFINTHFEHAFKFYIKPYDKLKNQTLNTKK
jgi:hypothetical protein